MPQNLANQFLMQVEPLRDRLWTQALAAGNARTAESELIKRLREAFATGKANGLVTEGTGESDAMPADVWARACAAIQIDAVRQAGGKGISAEGTSMPDPVLAPKKHVIKRDPEDMLNLSPAGRFLLGAAIVLIAGVWLTTFLMDRDVRPAETQPTTKGNHAASH